jgi:hypothetical protein
MSKLEPAIRVDQKPTKLAATEAKAGTALRLSLRLDPQTEQYNLNGLPCKTYKEDGKTWADNGQVRYLVAEDEVELKDGDLVVEE